MGDLQILLADTLNQLQSPINDYYDAIEGVDRSTPRGRIRYTQAVQKLSRTFETNLRRALTAVAVLSTNGQLTGTQKIIVNNAQTQQNSYAVGFMTAIDTLTRGQALTRAAMYLPAIVHLYSDVQIQSMPALPVRPGDGQTECTYWCKCTLEIVQVEGGIDVTWMLHPAEHCPDCLALAALWAPLRIRNGVIIDKHDYSFLSNRKMLKVLDALIKVSRSGYAIQD